MYIEQSVYGLTTINYTISLSQWLNYCSEWGLKVFFAVEDLKGSSDSFFTPGTKLARIKIWATLTGTALGSLIKSRM
jgi:hypothetical protein